MSDFRVYCKSMGKMGDVAIINYMSGTVTAEIEGRGYLLQEPDYILMKSTGLFDVNGNEIFEGDVVVVLDGMYTVFYDEKTASFRLKPHDKRWHTDYMSNYAHSDSFEVIGNIWENPELIEEVNNVVD